MIIRHNILALNTSRQLGIVSKSLTKNTEKLSSGYRINRAADDAAGLSISEKMRKQIRGLQQGIANAEDGISLCQVADGALNEVSDMIQRISELSVQAANGTNSVSDRQSIQMEISALLTEIDRVGETTKFNEIYLFKGGETMKDVLQNDASKPTAKGRFFQLLGSNVSTTGYMTEKLTDTMVTDSTSPLEDSTANPNALPYVSVHINFGAVENQLNDFVGTTFFANCCTDDCPTTVTFTDASSVTVNNNCDNIEIGLKKADGTYYQNAEEFCKYIVDSLKADNIAPHVMFAYKNSTLYLYDIDNNAWTTHDKQLAYFCDSKNIYDSYMEKEIFGTDNLIYIQSGADPGDGLYLTITSMSSKTLGLCGINVLTEDNATKVIDATNKALKRVSANRSRIGAQQNRLEHTVKNEGNIVENTTAAESQIRDTNMADTMTSFSVLSILKQAGQAMLVQANQSTQGVLSLVS